MGERARRKQEQHIHEAISDFIPPVNPRISTGSCLRLSLSRDSSRCDGPQLPPSHLVSSTCFHSTERSFGSYGDCS